MPAQIASLYWSNAGIAPGEGEISPYDFELRVRSAAKAGYMGIGFWHTDLEHILQTRTLRDIKSILDDHGVTAFEVEFIADWFVDGDKRAASDRRRMALLEASAALGAHHVKVGDFNNTPVTMTRLIDEFGVLCRDAEEFGATIGFEFMASAMIHTLEESLQMVDGTRNGGVIVDIAHVMALGIPYAAVAAIPPKHLVSVELNDGLLPTSPGYDGGATRRFPGEGEFDLAGFVAATRAAGYDGPWAVEVFAKALAQLPLEELDRRGVESARALLDR